MSHLIGIAGPSGAGKSYLASRLAEHLNAPVLALDRYYRDLSHLTPEERACCNFDDPSALEHELLITHVHELSQGKAVEVPVYDFSTHSRTIGTNILQPEEFVILEGLFTLYWPQLRQLLGTRVYVDVPDSVSLLRRQERDVRERGRTAESVVEQFRTTVAPMAERYVRPTRNHAHVLVSGAEPSESGVSRVLEHIKQCRDESERRAENQTKPLSVLGFQRGMR